MTEIEARSSDCFCAKLSSGHLGRQGKWTPAPSAGITCSAVGKFIVSKACFLVSAPSAFAPLFYKPSALYPPSYTSFSSPVSFLCYLFSFFLLLLLLGSSSSPPGKYQNKCYLSRAKNASALRLSPSAQSKNTFCPVEQNKKVWLRHCQPASW